MKKYKSDKLNAFSKDLYENVCINLDEYIPNVCRLVAGSIVRDFHVEDLTFGETNVKLKHLRETIDILLKTTEKELHVLYIEIKEELKKEKENGNS